MRQDGGYLSKGYQTETERKTSSWIRLHGDSHTPKKFKEPYDTQILLLSVLNLTFLIRQFIAIKNDSINGSDIFLIDWLTDMNGTSVSIELFYA